MSLCKPKPVYAAIHAAGGDVQVPKGGIHV